MQDSTSERFHTYTNNMHAIIACEVTLDVVVWVSVCVSVSMNVCDGGWSLGLCPDTALRGMTVPHHLLLREEASSACPWQRKPRGLLHTVQEVLCRIAERTQSSCSTLNI